MFGKTNISYVRVHIKWLKNVSFSETFAYWLNEWSLLACDQFLKFHFSNTADAKTECGFVSFF